MSGDPTLAAAVIGGIFGYLAEQEITNTTGTRYVIDFDGRQQVIIHKDTANPLPPGDTAIMIDDYKPRPVLHKISLTLPNRTTLPVV